MKQTTLQPQDIAFNKLYFVNLFKNGDQKFVNFSAAENQGDRLAKIANELKPADLEFLIGKIESIS